VSYRHKLESGAIKPIKVEWLFTRACPLACSYCGITTATVGHRPNLPIASCLRGLEQLRKIGVSFIACYGGEPTVRFKDLRNFILHAKTLGFQLTVISACVGMTEEKWGQLMLSGLDSITVSMDKPPDAEYQEAVEQGRRTDAVLKSLNFLRTRMSDIEIVMTVNRRNLDQVIPMLLWANQFGYWVHFDPQHTDRGQHGTKCIGFECAFKPEDQPQLMRVFGEVLRYKKLGARVHNDETSIANFAAGRYVLKYDWKCTDPFWLSVDCDGSLMACDDSIPLELKGRFNVTSLADDWHDFLKAWYAWRAKASCACAWMTHMMAKDQACSAKGPLAIAHGRG